MNKHMITNNISRYLEEMVLASALLVVIIEVEVVIIEVEVVIIEVESVVMGFSEVEVSSR